MDIILRLERPSDYYETESVVREAFWNHYSPECNEHYLLHIMRDCPTFLHELDVVAVHDGRIVGNVVYLKSVIRADEGNEYEVLSLGPIAVLPEYKGRGIGNRLIEYTRKLATEMGFRAILLYGDPDYYSRQGFTAAESFGIRTSDNMYATALHVCELFENALLGIKGCYFEDEVYSVDESSAKEFDKNFPQKEIVTGTPSQMKFIKISAMRKKAE
jgi:predicted N-acetyltransferase YhbS